MSELEQRSSLRETEARSVAEAQRQSRRQIAGFLLVVALFVALGVLLGALGGTPLRIGYPMTMATPTLGTDGDTDGAERSP